MPDIYNRIIPVLLVDRDKRLVKTINFESRIYVGDPFNAVRIFNEKEVDEICILDIDATRDNRRPDFAFIESIASECFMPLSYGGGIKSIKDCNLLNKIGVEKFILRNSATNLTFLREIISIFGSQSLSVSVDYKEKGEFFIRLSDTQILKESVISYCKNLESIGVGEIIIQSIDRDGLRTGYDYQMIRNVSEIIHIPLVALGGAGAAKHLAEAIRSGASAAASGSAFIFIGNLRSVLINYPNRDEIHDLLSND